MMQKTKSLTIAALLALVSVGGAFAQADAPAAPPEYASAIDDALIELRGAVSYSLDGYDGADVDAQIAALKARIEQAKKSVELAKVMRDASVKSGTNTTVLSNAQLELQTLQKRLLRLERTAPLQKKVDVKFENATVKQAAEALSKASGVKIQVDDDIPAETRLTVEARKIRLATVLESVAKQAGLIIEPINLDEGGDLGVSLTMPPMLRVNDKVQRFPSSPSPWSAAWGTPPTGRGLFGVGSPLIYFGNEAEKLAEIARLGEAVARREIPRAFQPYTVTSTQGRGTRSVITFPDGSRGEIGYVDKGVVVTITEVGKNDKGETGIYRSTFALKDGAFVRQSRVWSKK
ncbi:MAG: hypothetical protein H7Y38_20065 [Armatimonadetes bacterium]|nr:hypothetical protein [Armatimonadota bacterium]